MLFLLFVLMFLGSVSPLFVLIVSGSGVVRMGGSGVCCRGQRVRPNIA